MDLLSINVLLVTLYIPYHSNNYCMMYSDLCLSEAYPVFRIHPVDTKFLSVAVHFLFLVSWCQTVLYMMINNVLLFKFVCIRQNNEKVLKEFLNFGWVCSSVMIFVQNDIGMICLFDFLVITTAKLRLPFKFCLWERLQGISFLRWLEMLIIFRILRDIGNSRCENSRVLMRIRLFEISIRV